MSTWGIRALECDQGLDTMDCLSAFYLSSKHQISLDQMAFLLNQHGLLNSNNQEHNETSDISALVLSELLYEWHHYGTPQYDCECESAIWQSIKIFSASKEALTDLLSHLQNILDDVNTINEHRSLVKFWYHSAYWLAWVEHLENLIDNIMQLLDEA